MDRMIFSFMLFLVFNSALGQPPLTTDEALSRIYKGYDPATKTAKWECTAEQLKNGGNEDWDCHSGGESVSVSLILLAEVAEGDASVTYVAAFSNPIPGPGVGDYACHACPMAIGAGKFRLEKGKWTLVSANPAIGFFGGFGAPPDVSLVKAGPEQYGVLILDRDTGQGYSTSHQSLALPVGSPFDVVWSLRDEEDDISAVDPNEPGHLAIYRNAAAFRFIGMNDGLLEDKPQEPKFFDIEVISRGRTGAASGMATKPENWSEVYHFSNGKYRLVSRKAFVETPRSAPAKKVTAGR